jgi:coproporphyrinogen III oxidase
MRPARRRRHLPLTERRHTALTTTRKSERDADKSPFDHKRELKSANAVRALSNAVLPMYQKAVSRKRATSFTEEWESLDVVARGS